jgi:AcrR family transcriptional regulator
MSTPSSPPRRTYRSAQREQAAEATRASVIEAAKTLFAHEGIDRVTVAQIAQDAGVASSTIYALFKSKDGLLQAIMRTAIFGRDFQAAQAVMKCEGDAATQVALTAHVARTIWESESTELGLLRGASAFSPALRKLEAEFENLRHEMQGERLQLLFSQSKARQGLDLDTARRLMWMYTSRDIYRMLVHEGGWTPQRYQSWLADTLLAELVQPRAAAVARRRAGAML